MNFPSLQTIVMSIPGVVIGFAFHEFAHAWVATWFGDDTPRAQGRVTLNPMAHLDPLGTILLLLGAFGWAKPVQINLNRVKPRVLGDIAISLAGVTMNFLLAVLFFFLAFLAQAGVFGFQHEVLSLTLVQVGWMNTIMVGFNLIPLPPFDGFHVVKYLFPAGSSELVAKLYQFGPYIVILLFLTDIADRFLDPVYEGLLTAAMGIARPVALWLISLF